MKFTESSKKKNKKMQTMYPDLNITSITRGEEEKEDIEKEE